MNNLKFYYRFLTSLVVALSSICFINCSSTSSAVGGGGDTTSTTYSGPGSFYTADLDDAGGFTVTIADDSVSAAHSTLTGTYEELDSGFLKLTVTAVDSTSGTPPSVGSEAVGLLIEGLALFLKPLDSDEVIPMIVSGTCPTADFSANWLIGQGDSQDYSSADQDAFGDFNYDAATGMATVENHYNLTSFAAVDSDAPNSLDASACADGFIRLAEGDVTLANMWLTAVGGAIIETFADDGVTRNSSIVALPESEISDIADFAGNYAAIAFSSTLGGVKPLAIIIAADGTGTAEVLDEVDPATSSGDSVTINLNGTINIPSTGFVTGTISDGTDTGNMACSALADANSSGKNVLACNGQLPSDHSNQFLVLMVENL